MKNNWIFQGWYRKWILYKICSFVIFRLLKKMKNDWYHVHWYFEAQSIDYLQLLLLATKVVLHFTVQPYHSSFSHWPIAITNQPYTHKWNNEINWTKTHPEHDLPVLYHLFVCDLQMPYSIPSVSKSRCGSMLRHETDCTEDILEMGYVRSLRFLIFEKFEQQERLIRVAK